MRLRWFKRRTPQLRPVHGPWPSLRVNPEIGLAGAIALCDAAGGGRINLDPGIYPGIEVPSNTVLIGAPPLSSARGFHSTR